MLPELEAHPRVLEVREAGTTKAKIVFGNWACEVEGSPEFVERECDKFLELVRFIFRQAGLATSTTPWADAVSKPQ